MGALSRMKVWLSSYVSSTPIRNPSAELTRFSDTLMGLVAGLTSGTTVLTSSFPDPEVYTPTGIGERVGEIWVSSDRSPSLAWIWTPTGWSGLSGAVSGSSSYVLPTASASILGGIKVGANLSIDGSGILSGAAPYTLPTASASILGGIQVGARLTMTGNTLSADVQTTAPAGATTQVIFNDAGAYAGDAGLTYNKTTDVLTAVGGFVGNVTAAPLSFLKLTGTIASGASAVSVVVDSPSYATDGALLLSVRNAGAQKLAVDFAGSLFGTSVWTGAAADTYSSVKFGYGSVNRNNSAAIGTNAMLANTGAYNTALGNLALANSSAASSSVAIGELALLRCYGSNNVAVGRGTLQGNELTGSFNTAVGFEAMQTLLGTSNNTAVGAYAGKLDNTASLAAYSQDSVFIGALAKAGVPGGATNEIVIGASSIGNGSNTVTLGNNSITKTYLKGVLTSLVADGASSVGHTLDTSSLLSTAGAKLLSLKNQTTEKAYVDLDGRYINTTGLYDDVQGEIAQAAIAGALTFEVYRDTEYRAYYFRHDQNDTLHMSFQMPHSWDRGTVYPHIHIIPMVNPAAAQVVRFTGKYCWSQVGVALPADASWTAFTIDHTVNTTDEFKQTVVGLATITPPTSPKESNVLLIWVRRPGLADAADTYTTSKATGTAAANLMVVSIDTHIQKVKVGTTTAIPV
jgi:hypothetical protein